MTSETDATADFDRREQPESFRARSQAVSISADDVDASLTWYRDVVGFSVKEEWREEGVLRGVELVAGNARIFLAQDDGARGRDRDKGQGCSIHLTTAQDVDELAAGIEERGGSLASEPADSPWGARTFQLVDPDGFKYYVSSEE